MTMALIRPDALCGLAAAPSGFSSLALASLAVGFGLGLARRLGSVRLGLVVRALARLDRLRHAVGIGGVGRTRDARGQHQGLALGLVGAQQADRIGRRR